MTRNLVSADGFVNAETASETARGSADRCRKTDGTSFSNSAKFTQAAYLSGEKGAKVALYKNMLVSERYLTMEEAIQRAEWASIERRGGKRKKIGKLSKKSKYALLKRLGEIGRVDPPLMVTLTYRNPTDPKRAKHHYRVFAQWLQRTYDAGTGWRLELQTNKHKNVHFHTLVWGDCANARDDAQVRAIEHDMKTKWCEITGDGGEDRMRYGCHVIQSDGSAKAMNYLIGHSMKKTEQEATDHGRHWGFTNRKVLKMGESMDQGELNMRQSNILRRFSCNLINSRRKGKGYRKNNARTLYLTLSRVNQRRLMDWLLTQ